MNQCHLELRLDNCPQGWVLNPMEPSADVDACFTEWVAPTVPPAYWKHYSLMKVAHLPQGPVLHGHSNRPVLHFDLEADARAGWDGTRFDRSLVTRQPVPPDCIVRARVALLSDRTRPLEDRVDNRIAAVGIVARMLNVRQYYFLCIQADGKLALIRRSDDEWLELASTCIKPEMGAWYCLELSCRGDRLEASLDGRRVFAVTDDRFERGLAGVRTNAAAYVDQLVIRADGPAVRRFAAQQAREEDRRAAMAQRMPEPVVHSTFTLAEPIAAVTFAARLARRDEAQLIGSGSEAGGAGATLCMDLRGREIWRLAGELTSCIAAPRADGLNDIFGRLGDEHVLVDGPTGRIVRRLKTPASDDPKAIVVPVGECVANLSGAPLAGEFFLREELPTSGGAGFRCWAVSRKLDILWEKRILPPFGHSRSFAFCDVNGDGREEVLAGPTLLSHDGKVIWQWEDADLLYQPGHYHRPDHVDSVAMGFFDADSEIGPVAHLQLGCNGNAVVDARTGRTLAIHRLGHVQWCQVGRLLEDHDGLQVLTNSRWGTYGYMAVFSATGKRLGTLQCDYLGAMHCPVNWTGDGWEHILLMGSQDALGLYDATGRKLVKFDVPCPNRANGAMAMVQDLTGDPRDEIVLQSGRVVNILTPGPMKTAASRVYAPIRRGNVSLPGWAPAK